MTPVLAASLHIFTLYCREKGYRRIRNDCWLKLDGEEVFYINRPEQIMGLRFTTLILTNGYWKNPDHEIIYEMAIAFGAVIRIDTF